MTNHLTTRRQAADYDRIAAAIEFLDHNRRRQPSLAETAAHVGLSPFHFQRLFRRWAGISPKQFLHYLAIDHARRLLTQGRSLFTTSLDVGLSGPSRLHDLFVTIDAVTPGEYKRGGAGVVVAYGMHHSPFGVCLIGRTERGICWLSFVEGEEEEAVGALEQTWPHARLRRDPAATRAAAETIFAVDRTSGGEMRLCVRGTNFQVKVWEALIRVPPGDVVSYKDLAAAVGAGEASRAVGQAVAANPLAYVIPCHRVIRSTGVAGEYRWGAPRKRAMLAWEAAMRGETAAVDRGLLVAGS